MKGRFRQKIQSTPPFVLSLIPVRAFGREERRYLIISQYIGLSKDNCYNFDRLSLSSLCRHKKKIYANSCEIFLFLFIFYVLSLFFFLLAAIFFLSTYLVLGGNFNFQQRNKYLYSSVYNPRERKILRKEGFRVIPFSSSLFFFSLHSNTFYYLPRRWVSKINQVLDDKENLGEERKNQRD